MTCTRISRIPTQLLFGCLLSCLGSLTPAFSAETPSPAPTPEPGTFLAAHGSLRDYLFTEPSSDFGLGIGIIPIGVMGGKFFVGIDVFQVNWANSWLDWEILSTTIGLGFAQNSNNNAKYFLATTRPKLRISEFLSVGVMAGYESVTFPNLESFIQKNRKVTPTEPFSTSSFIYGLAASEYLTLSNSKKIKISELVFTEHYSVDQTSSGWTFNFPQYGADFDKTPISASLVFMLEVSLIF